LLSLLGDVAQKHFREELSTQPTLGRMAKKYDDRQKGASTYALRLLKNMREIPHQFPNHQILLYTGGWDKKVLG